MSISARAAPKKTRWPVANAFLGGTRTDGHPPSERAYDRGAADARLHDASSRARDRARRWRRTRAGRAGHCGHAAGAAAALVGRAAIQRAGLAGRAGGWI